MRRERERNHPSESSSLAWRGSEYRHKIPRNESLGWGDGGTRRAIRKRALRGAPGGLVGGQLFELITLRKSRGHAIDTGAPHTRARKLASRRDGRTRAEQHEPTQFAGAHVTLLAAVRGAIVQLRRPRSTLALSSPGGDAVSARRTRPRVGTLAPIGSVGAGEGGRPRTESHPGRVRR